jgi:uncharacterized protein YcaQ
VAATSTLLDPSTALVEGGRLRLLPGRSAARRRTPERLGLNSARRVALAAQGFDRPRPAGAITARHLQRVIDTVGVLQIDSVNVLSRSHYLPVFSRLGPYPRRLLDRSTQRPPRRLVEYWAHEASFLPPATLRLLRWRMARAEDEAWAGIVRVVRGQPHLLDAVRQVVSELGPLTSAEIERSLARPAERSRTDWGWNWSDTKRAVAFLFWAGEISSAGRTAQFERRYDLPERVVPPAVWALPEPDPAEAVRELIRIAARACGVATQQSLRDYFRLRPADALPAIASLVETGELLPVQVEGWSRPGYLHADARIPRRIEASALLSPFDSLIWHRERTESLFGFRYRLEIYVPAARRVHGYYVLPFLLGDRLVARVDLKADRPDASGSSGRLLVRSAWSEPDPPADVAVRLASELTALAGWLDLGDVAVEDAGDLAPALRAALPPA